MADSTGAAISPRQFHELLGDSFLAAFTGVQFRDRAAMQRVIDNDQRLLDSWTECLPAFQQAYRAMCEHCGDLPLVITPVGHRAASYHNAEFDMLPAILLEVCELDDDNLLRVPDELDDQACASSAGLTAIPVDGERRTGRCLLQVGIGEHYVGTLAAQFQKCALQVGLS